MHHISHHVTALTLAAAVCCNAYVSGDSAPGGQSAQDASRAIRLPVVPYNYSEISLPKYVRQAAKRFDNTPRDNPITDAGATLGRVLFYDKTLSANGTTSCATCHKQAIAFTDDRKLSVGFEGIEVTRNSMSLINARYYRRGRFFWDERAPTLEDQVLMPIENEVEMGHTLNTLTTQLQSDPLYPSLFKSAFGSDEVTQDRIAKALAQFVRSIVSFRSKYDIGREQVESPLDPFPNFTAQENLGKQQFFGRANCASCHLADTAIPRDGLRQSSFFFVDQPVVNGIDSDTDGADAGVGKHTGRSSDVGRFKVSSLRNVELTGPYMHDGRFITLDSVIEHYNWSVRPHPNLDERLADFAANGLALPEVPKVALTVFLTTLTDHSLLQDPRYSDPFVDPPDSRHQQRQDAR